MRLTRLTTAISAASLALFLSACVSGSAQQTNPPRGSRAHAGLDLAGVDSSLSDPPYFVYDTTGGKSELLSPSNGALVEVLGKFGDALTTNGLAESSDGKDVYVTLIGKKKLYIEQISTVTKKQTVLVNGVQPALSPDAKFLAYASGPEYTNILAVREMSSGKTTSINLSSLLGSSTNLLDATITWLGDGSDIVIEPGWDGSSTSTISASAPSAKNSCSAVSPVKATCLIEVHFDASNGTLSPRLIVIHDLGGNFSVISGADSDPHSLTFALWGKKTNVYEITLSGSATHVTHLLTLAMVLPVAFDLMGTHLFYIVGHGPTDLWVANIGPGHPVQAHRLVANADVSDIAW